ncbi:penicillin-binding protein [Corallococcus exiguus]|uniref:transglycosylase domain-containing protein n=1 Tax=Corallococcus exiguus TaxID=83462 RepID=UPI001A8CD42F|nr:penicillin-binding protein [Corallococcus exiguus]
MVTLLLRATGLIVLACIGGIAWVSRELPTVAYLGKENPEQTSYMRRAIAAGRLDPTARLAWTPLKAISQGTVCGLVKSEDAIFFQHDGFNYRQTWMALQGQMQGKQVGHSTITMQLARNLFLGPEQTFDRKLREVLLTRYLERELTKPRLLELYLNVMELGPKVWGVAQASQYYFQKTPAELDAFEGTFFGAIAPAPLQPLAGSNRERARRKQAQVLWRLYVSGVISPAQYQAAQSRHLAVFQALNAGASLREALDRPVPTDAPLPSLPHRIVSGELPGERMVDEACGYAAELKHWMRRDVPKF